MNDESTNRALALAVLQASDELKKLKASHMEAMDLIKKLSLEVSAMYEENTQLLNALRQMTLTARARKDK